MKNNYRLIVGLGNPGEKYSKNRHNSGFIILNEAKRFLELSDFKFENKFNAEISRNSQPKNFSFFKKLFNNSNDKSKHTSREVILVKPTTFMNRSGEVVRKFIDFYKIPIEDITIIHDDLDLSVGSYKISENSGAGGHNGVQNIIDMLGTQKFKRIRIGVEKKEGRESRQIPGEKFVLQDFSENELEEVKNLAKKINIVT